MSDKEKKIRLKLSTPRDIRKTLSKITNMIINNEIIIEGIVPNVGQMIEILKNVDHK